MVKFTTPWSNRRDGASISNSALGSKPLQWRQPVATLGSALIVMSGGSSIGYSAILLPQLDTTYLKNKEIGSWIASITPLSMSLGSIATGFLADRFGRRNSNLILAAPLLFGWLLIAFATNSIFLLVGRFITGLCTGAIRTLATIFVGEITTPKYRGLASICITLAMNLGTLTVHIAGSFLNWRVTAGIFCVPIVIGFVMLKFLPKSPTWLISKGYIEAGVAAFTKYRGNSEAEQNEVKDIIEKQSKKTFDMNFKGTAKIMCTKEFLKPFRNSVILFTSAQFCGINTMPFYAADILERTITNIDPFISMVLVDSLRVSVTLAFCFIGKKLRRRITFLSCSIITFSILYILVVYLLIKPLKMEWISIICIVIYGITGSAIVTLAYSFLAEIFPVRVRGLGSGLSASLSYLFLFVSVKTTPDIMSNYGEAVLYSLFATTTFVCTIFLWFLLPRTDGRTLQEIEDNI